MRTRSQVCEHERKDDHDDGCPVPLRRRAVPPFRIPLEGGIQEAGDFVPMSWDIGTQQDTEFLPVTAKMKMARTSPDQDHRGKPGQFVFARFSRPAVVERDSGGPDRKRRGRQDPAILRQAQERRDVANNAPLELNPFSSHKKRQRPTWGRFRF
jgi:hypothetical protein